MPGYCDSAPGHPLHGPYHDGEYGFPSADEAVLFERLVLEINQAGLSWLTILQKRPNFRNAFAGFADLGRRLRPDLEPRVRREKRQRGSFDRHSVLSGVQRALLLTFRGRSRCAPSASRSRSK